MGHTYYQVHEHIVFSTKNRVPYLRDDIQLEVHPYLAVAVRNHGCECLMVGGVQEHIHMLVRKSQLILTGDLVKEIKRTSTIWLKGKGGFTADFAWQSGYGAFGVSYSNIDAVTQYIANQKQHHKDMTWEEEFGLMLKRNGVEYDPRYYLD